MADDHEGRIYSPDYQHEVIFKGPLTVTEPTPEPEQQHPPSGEGISVLFVGKRPQESLFTPVTLDGQRALKKPRGGLWTCPDNERGHSAWREWDRTEGCGFTRHARTWRLTALPSRVYIIDSVLDLRIALARWPHQRYPHIPSLRDEREIDFVSMAIEYDAVYLTEEGQWRTRLSFPENLYGWDLPSILWFRWMFSSVEPARRALAAAADARPREGGVSDESAAGRDHSAPSGTVQRRAISA